MSIERIVFHEEFEIFYGMSGESIREEFSKARERALEKLNVWYNENQIATIISIRERGFDSREVADSPLWFELVVYWK